MVAGLMLAASNYILCAQAYFDTTARILRSRTMLMRLAADQHVSREAIS